MASIKSGASGQGLIVDADSKAARVTPYTTLGNEVYPAANQFIVAGNAAAVVAASLGADTTLMSMRNGSSKSLYITRLKLHLAVATIGANGGVPGSIGWMRFSTATPTGGTARYPAAKNLKYFSTVSDVRDSNAALTVTSVVFGGVLAQTVIPNMTGGAPSPAWDIPMFEDPIIIPADGGICLRTIVGCPGTQTWLYSYVIEWYEI